MDSIEKNRIMYFETLLNIFILSNLSFISYLVYYKFLKRIQIFFKGDRIILKSYKM